MFCKNCGNEMKDGVQFCGKCGAKTESFSESVSNGNVSAETRNVPVEDNSKISRDTYLGKAYIFDYYIGVNLRGFRISRRAVGFNDDNILY